MNNMNLNLNMKLNMLLKFKPNWLSRFWENTCASNIYLYTLRKQFCQSNKNILLVFMQQNILLCQQNILLYQSNFVYLNKMFC